MKSYMQRMGRSIQLPVSVLPAAALLVGIGHWLPEKWAAAQFLMAGGNAVLGILALLFALGLASGMSKHQDGASAIAGLVAYSVPVAVLAPASIATLEGIKQSAVDPAFSAISGNVFIGILGGLIAAALYNRFSETKLPMALSFFSGKRCVPILTAGVMLVISLLLLFIWPPIYNVLVAFGKMMVSLGAVGAGLYGFFNRLLIPTGLHQALNSVFWFNIAGINDIGNFWANAGTKGVTGMYMAGFFPVMMFGLPAGALAIYRNAKPEKKAQTGSLMLAGAFAAFFTGVTEPLEFSFMFVAWPLYVMHAVLTGLSLAFAAFMHWTAGFTFSAGLVDFILSSRMPIANMPYMLIVQGLVMAVIYYFTFDFAIKKFNLMTPGREEDVASTTADVAASVGDDKYSLKAKRIYMALGGFDNLLVVDNCTTRLRLQLADTKKIDTPAIKAAGAVGVNAIDQRNLQIIIGTDVQFVADPLKSLVEAKTPLSTLTADAIKPVPSMTTPEAKAPQHTVSESVYSAADGELVDLAKVSDATFAQKMLGDGYAIEPSDGKIVAPVSGVVTAVFPTKHAVGITTPAGLEVLIHIGIDTVTLDGKPFVTHVAVDDQVTYGDLLVTADLEAIKAAGKPVTTMVIFTNMDHVAALKDRTSLGEIKASDFVLTADALAD
ncbi:N-acetylglucosamine-specific PTS transporter subunit IIBC [Lacticaseibacillus porcinae]|uniref:N-acetylglucosamine-specific PTS transporter subunit IIBC n=1 Tax=Lacticaseibacillus porcinae TaxID=1123687 RepID=UPI000F7ACFE2|nr:N-acetylglucosamine-specific PTS transporter subunit IIBC [Lacticaseibacillus porcinae]